MAVLGSCCNACLTPRRKRHFGHISFFHMSQNFSVLVFARTPVLLHLMPACGAIRGTRENPRCHLVSSVASELPLFETLCPFHSMVGHMLSEEHFASSHRSQIRSSHHQNTKVNPRYKSVKKKKPWRVKALRLEHTEPAPEALHVQMFELPQALPSCDHLRRGRIGG